MDTSFCARYRGDGSAPSNRFCRNCPHAEEACDALWDRVKSLSESRGNEGLPLPGTRAVLLPHPKREFVRLRVNCTWGLPIEDFLHFIATDHAGMGRRGVWDDMAVSPSKTRQTPYVQSIAALLGGDECPEIRAVRRVQQKRCSH